MGNCFINRTPTGIVDQSFNAFSTNAQSGIAVREAINTIIVDTTYDPLSANAQSGVAVKQAIDALDVTTSGAGTNKTLTALSQTDGKISATFNNISITKSQVSDFPTSMTPTSHSHGNITNDGKLGTDVAKASGDKFVLVDASDSNKIIRSNIALGTSTSTYLRNDGAWGTPAGTFDVVNTGSVLATKSNASYTATQNCICFTETTVANGAYGAYKLGNTTLSQSASFPLKSGQTVTYSAGGVKIIAFAVTK